MTLGAFITVGMKNLGQLRLVILLMLAVLGVFPGGGALAQQIVDKERGAGQGWLVGRVVRGPLRPVEKPGGPPSQGPQAGARVIVRNLTGEEVGTAVTDNEGEYRLALPPGSYRVDLAWLRPGEFTKDLPVIVVIHAGGESRLNVRVDTGIR